MYIVTLKLYGRKVWMVSTIKRRLVLRLSMYKSSLTTLVVVLESTDADLLYSCFEHMQSKKTLYMIVPLTVLATERRRLMDMAAG